MTTESGDAQGVEALFETPDLAEALESDRFKQFLDQLPVAIAVAELKPTERIVYANQEFVRLTGQDAAKIIGKFWDLLPGAPGAPDDHVELGKAIAEERDHLGVFTLRHDEATIEVDAWANIIADEGGAPVFRLVALVERVASAEVAGGDLEQRIEAKDTLLKELQHRVRNNLQMITALIRAEARSVPDNAVGERFDRLAGRIEALSLLYRSLGEAQSAATIDLGVYLSEIATAVMHAHAPEGIRLDLQVDTWPVSIDVAMPAGLVVNELLTNALKHAFEGREGGTITLHSLAQGDGCKVVVADDGVGLPQGVSWPKPGKLSALIVRSLLHNATAKMEVKSTPGKGLRVTIFFACADAAPPAAA